MIFIRIPKTASTSITKCIGDKIVEKAACRMAGWRKQKRLSNLSLFVSQHHENWENIFSFSFVRNPWDRMVSHWKMFNNSNQAREFPKHVDMLRQNKYTWNIQWHACSQYDQLVHEGRQLVTFIGRFEKLKEDFKYVCDQVGVERSLGEHMRFPSKPYQDFYNEETWQMVAEMYKDDIEYFGY